MGKVDILAHSNGGLLSRQYIQSMSYKNDINKLITFNTPHLGSQLANILREPSYDWLGFALFQLTALVGDPNDATEGVIDDLKVDGDFIKNLNGDYSLLNKYNDIGIHTITSTETVDNIIGNLDLLITYFLKFHWEEALEVVLEEKVFHSPNHDMIVAEESQKGGVLTTTPFSNQIHMGSTINPLILTKTIELLNQNPKDSNYFSNKFNPSELELPDLPGISSKMHSSKKIAETITITSPVEGTNYKAGVDLNIVVNGSVGVENIVSAMGNDIIPIQVHKNENVNNSNFNFKIPNNAIGRLNILSVGFSVNGYEDFDSTYIMVTTDAVLDSIEIDQQLIFVSEGGESAITILGHYNDGETRNITNVDDLVYSFDNDNAEVIERGVVAGLNEGEANLTVTYLGKSANVPVTIVESSSLDIEDDVISNETFSIYPNPTSNKLTIKFPVNQIKAEVSIYTLLGQHVFSKEISSSENDLNIDNLQNGMYLVKIKSDSITAIMRIIKQ
jgi:hypothetical protein